VCGVGCGCGWGWGWGGWWCWVVLGVFWVVWRSSVGFGGVADLVGLLGVFVLCVGVGGRVCGFCFGGCWFSSSCGVFLLLLCFFFCVVFGGFVGVGVFWWCLWVWLGWCVCWGGGGLWCGCG
ncbi:hypothetical protein, partial [Pseudomonas syringae group genomosp. 7]|uniref:hypothetical protein n=1 Tax=Pseudomonas syringae group genomosp. 7 TaxID=251699 RepID=UPI0037703979